MLPSRPDESHVTPCLFFHGYKVLPSFKSFRSLFAVESFSLVGLRLITLGDMGGHWFRVSRPKVLHILLTLVDLGRSLGLPPLPLSLLARTQKFGKSIVSGQWILNCPRDLDPIPKRHSSCLEMILNESNEPPRTPDQLIYDVAWDAAWRRPSRYQVFLALFLDVWYAEYGEGLYWSFSFLAIVIMRLFCCQWSFWLELYPFPWFSLSESMDF